MLTFPDGGSIEVPLVGCSDDRPECCPSLSFTTREPEETGSSSESSSTESESEEPSTSWTATTPSPLPTGVISMLSKAPLTVCPRYAPRTPGMRASTDPVRVTWWTLIPYAGRHPRFFLAPLAGLTNSLQVLPASRYIAKF
jgi:hypothetical protein